MFEIIDHAHVQFARSLGALVSRPLSTEELSAHAPSEFVVPAVVAYDLIRAELKQHDSLWHISAKVSARVTYGPPKNDPLEQRSQGEEPALNVAFARHSDGGRKYMLTFAGEATEIATIEEVIDRIKSLYARALVEGPEWIS